MAAVRRTSRDGDVWEITARALTAMAAGVVIVTGVVSLLTAAVTTHQQLREATPVTRHDSLQRVVARNDTALAGIRATIAAMQQNILGLNCQQAHYPSPFCDGVTRVEATR